MKFYVFISLELCCIKH